MRSKAREVVKPIIKQEEGLELTAYLCPAKVWTIGYGHTEGVKPGQTITESEAEELLDKDINKWLDDVAKLSPNVKKNPYQWAAITSFAYNCGIGAYKASTLRKKYDAGDIAGAANEFGKWNKATVAGKKVELRGLTARREREKELFLTDYE